ncbi:MAG: squalene/phytoene synthase family protein [Planctomycetota bacterium]
MYQELLEPTPTSLREASHKCRSWLFRQNLWFALLLRADAVESGNALATAAAFESLVRKIFAVPSIAQREEHAHLLGQEIDLGAEGRALSVMGRSLSEPFQRYEIPPFLFRSRLPALQTEASLATVGTREELHALAKRLAHPTGRIALRILGAASERNEVLADALATGVQLALWLRWLAEDWRAGRLRLPMDELAHHRVDLASLSSERTGDGVRSVVARSVADAREALAKGWPLTDALGPLHGRRLAVFLRWHAASLSAIEFADYDALRHPPRGGLLRGLACVAAGSATVRAPF